MSRVSIFLKDKLLEEVDRQAKEEGSSRSALIRAAVEKYVEANRRVQEEEDRRRTMREAARKMDVLAEKLGQWDPQTTLRKFRDAHLKRGSR